MPGKLGRRPSPANEVRIGQLRRHALAQREKSVLESEKEEPEPQNHIDRADQYLAQIRDLLAQHAKLEAQQNRRDRRHVAKGADQRPNQIRGEAQSPVHAQTSTTMPKTRTKTMGIKLANAISPNPSTIGLRPLITPASPTPSAVTSGTVMVEVVTPPLS